LDLITYEKEGTIHKAALRGSLLNFVGSSLDPPAFASAIKCHQKSTSSSAGSSVGSLAPPRATPRLGGVYASCQYFPCSFVLALRELGLRLGVKAQLPLRASSRGVPLPGAPNARPVRFHLEFEQLAH